MPIQKRLVNNILEGWAKRTPYLGLIGLMTSENLHLKIDQNYSHWPPKWLANFTFFNKGLGKKVVDNSPSYPTSSYAPATQKRIFKPRKFNFATPK